MIDKSYKQWYEAGNKKPRKGFWWGGSPSDYDTPSPSPSYSGDYEGEAYGTTPAASYSDPSPAPSPSSNDNWDQSPADQPAPAPVDYASLDNEEQQAVDRGEPTAQMTPTERNEQGYGPGGTDNPDYKRKQYEITGDIDELADFRGIDTRPKVDIADIHGETDDPDSVTFAGTDARGNILYDPAAQAAATRKAIAEYKPGFNIKEKTTDFAKSQAKKMVRNKVMKELGLAGINPLLTLGSFLLGKFAPNKKSALQSKIAAATKNLTKKREPNILDEFGYKGNVYAKKPVEQSDSSNDIAQVVSGKQDVVSKAVNQFRGTKVDDQISSLVTNNLNKALQFYARMTPMVEAGKASQQEMDAYELLGFYLNKQNQAMQGGNKYI